MYVYVCMYLCLYVCLYIQCGTYIYICKHVHLHHRGITLEMSVDLITSNPRSLWGGINLRETSSGHHLSREKTVEFFLTTYRSFVHPLIFMRLLLHRLATLITYLTDPMPTIITLPFDINPNLFDWSHDTKMTTPTFISALCEILI